MTAISAHTFCLKNHSLQSITVQCNIIKITNWLLWWHISALWLHLLRAVYCMTYTIIGLWHTIITMHKIIINTLSGHSVHATLIMLCILLNTVHRCHCPHHQTTHTMLWMMTVCIDIVIYTHVHSTFSAWCNAHYAPVYYVLTCRTIIITLNNTPILCTRSSLYRNRCADSTRFIFKYKPWKVVS